MNKLVADSIPFSTDSTPKKKSLICFEVKIKKLVKKGENNKVTGDWGGTLSFVHENLTIVYHVRTTIGFKSLYFFP